MPIRRTILHELTATVRAMLAREMPERVVFLTGEAGIGKSTLLRQLVEELESGVTTTQGKSTDSTQLPTIAIAECSTPVAGSGVGLVEALKPFADIMAALLEAGADTSKKKKLGGFKLDIGKFLVDTAPSWIGLIPLVGAPIFHALSIVGSGYDQVYLHKKLKSGGSNAATDQQQVFQQYINFLSKLSDQTPVLIVLDDFHWADTSSTNLLFAAARELASKNVVFLVSYRDNDVQESSKQLEHPIVHVRNELERYALCRALDVPRADLHDIQVLLVDTYPAYTSDAKLEHWLLKVTDGNLLFTTHYLSTLEHEHYIEPVTGKLLKDLSTMSVPTTANAVVVEYIRRLGTEDKEQLRYASVEGETITASMTSRLLDLPVIRVVQRLRTLVEQQHIVRALGTQVLYASESSAYQFVHYLVHKTLYDGLAIEERSALHGTAADVLQEELAIAESKQYNVHIIAARLAAHALIAGRDSQAALALLKGAEWVWRSFSADEALRLVEECQSIVKSVTERQADTPTQPLTSLRSIGVDALLLEADIMRHRADYARAAACFEEAMTLSLNVGSASQQCKSLIGLAVVRAYEGLQDEAEALARDGLRIAGETDDVPNQIHAMRVVGITYANRSRFEQAMECDKQCLELATQIGDENGRAGAYMNLGCVLDYRGEALSALEHHNAALNIYRSLYRTDGVISSLLNIGGTLNTLDLQSEAMEHFEEALMLAQSIGALREEAKILNNMGMVRRRQGFVDQALDLVQRSLALMERIGDREAIVHALPAIGDIYRDTERPDIAIDFYKRSGTIAAEINNPAGIARASLFIAFVHLLENRPEIALPVFAECRTQFAAIGAFNREIEAALGIATCNAKLSATANDAEVSVTAETMLASVRAIVTEHDLDLTLYDRVWAEWVLDLDRFGLALRTR